MKRVAAYCRVSTDKSDQINSFSSQKMFFVEYINSRAGWTLTDIYADEGITGTMTAHRTGFLSMIDDATCGKFDIILTKEVSRFSRNILDTISYTRRLKHMGVGVIFLNDGISTLDPDAELRLSIMAAVAQEESRKTSERVKWGQARRMERGTVFGRSLLGYDVKDGRITIEPVGAETVRRIYSMYLEEGLGVRSIAAMLTADGTFTKSGRSVWSGAAVLKILRNEKYCGDLVQRKTMTTDYLTHERKKSHSSERITILEHHTPIIQRCIWEAVQAELSRRSNKTPQQNTGSRYSLSGKIACGHCAAPYYCRTRKRADGSTYRVWRSADCICQAVRHQLREESITQVIRRISATHLNAWLAAALRELIKNIGGIPACESEKILHSMSVLKDKRLKLTDAFISGTISQEDFYCLKRRYEYELTECRQLVDSKPSALMTQAEQLEQAVELLLSGKDEDDDFYLSLVEKIHVVDKTGLDIYLREMPVKWTVRLYPDKSDYNDNNLC